MRAQPRCPRCRQLGYTTDCSERLIHARKEKSMSALSDDDQIELEVTLKFAVPVDPDNDLDPHQLATRVRESWVEEPGDFAAVIADALVDDYDLQVRPVALL